MSPRNLPPSGRSHADAPLLLPHATIADGPRPCWPRCCLPHAAVTMTTIITAAEARRRSRQTAAS